MLPERPNQDDLLRIRQSLEDRAVESLSGDEWSDYLKALHGLDLWQDALATSALAVGSYPESLLLGSQRAKILYRAGDLHGHYAYLEDLLRRFPDHPEISLEIAKLFIGSRDPELAAKYLRLAKERAPLHPEVLLTLGHIRFFANAFEEAKVYYSRYLEVAPETYPYIHATELIPSFISLCDFCRGKELYQMTWPEEPCVLPLGEVDRFSLVEARLNGHGPYQFIVDTGGGMFNAVSQQLFHECRGQVGTEVVLHGIGGRQQQLCPIGLLDTFTLGGLEARNALVLCMDFSAIEQALGFPMAGIISPGWLLSARMDWTSGSFALQPSAALAEGKRLRYDEHTERTREDGAAETIVPLFLLQDSKPIVPVTWQGRTGWFILDSGAEHTFISAAWFREAHPRGTFEVQQVPSLGVGDRASVSKLLIGDEAELEIGSFVYPMDRIIGYSNIDEEVSPRLGFEVAGILGHDFISAFDAVTVDLGNATLRLVEESGL